MGLAATGVERRIELTHPLETTLLVLVGTLAIALAAWSIASGGTGLDATLETRGAIAIREVNTSWTLRQAYDFVPANKEFYGPLPQQLADTLHRIRVGSPGGKPLQPESGSTYLYQGYANLLLSVFAVTVLAIVLAVVLRSVIAGALAWSLTLSTPLWLGMSQIDYKDVPVASGVTLVTAGLILGMTVDLPPVGAVAGVGLAALGGAITLATRPGSLPVLAVLGLGTIVAAVAARRPAVAISVSICVFASLFFAVVALWATNPLARISLFGYLRDATQVARQIEFDSVVRVAGQDVRTTHIPWWYVPAWVGAQLPLLTAVALIVAFVVIARWLLRTRAAIDSRTALPLVPLALQAIMIPLVAVASGAIIYDALRHLLFMFPALLALPAFALALLERRPGSLRPRLRAALPAAAVVVVAMSFFAAARWAPYSYAFVNPIAGIRHDHRDWELDYWGASAREGVRRLEKLGYTPIDVQPSDASATPWGVPSDSGDGRRPGAYVFLRWTASAKALGCTDVFTIKRDGHVLGEGARCPAPSS